MRDEHRIGAVLPAVLQRVHAQRTVLMAVRRRWPSLVGRALAAHTAPVSVRKGQLVVVVDHPGDGFALRYQQQRLVLKVQALTQGKVTGIIIRPGEIPSDAISH